MTGDRRRTDPGEEWRINTEESGKGADGDRDGVERQK